MNIEYLTAAVIVLAISIGVLALVVVRNSRRAGKETDDAHHASETGLRWIRDNLAAYKLEVAKSYASLSFLKEVERRLTGHLIRIEDKLDVEKDSG